MCLTTCKYRGPRGSLLPSSPINLPTCTLGPFPPLMERKYPPGIWLHWPDSMAGDERGVVLGALEAFQLGSPEGGLG